MSNRRILRPRRTLIDQHPNDQTSNSINEFKLYLDILPNDILQYMFTNKYLSPELNIMWNYILSLNKAISKIPKVKMTFFYSEEEILLNYCAEKGYIKILQWALHKNMKFSVNVCSEAARGGHLKILKWLRSNRCPWYKDVCSNAAEGGHIEILQWLRSNGCPWNGRTCSGAAGGGHLEILKWARENGCPWDEHVCSSAAIGGHLEVLKWLQSNGAPWDKPHCERIAEGETLDWIKQQNEFLQANVGVSNNETIINE